MSVLIGEDVELSVNDLHRGRMTPYFFIYTSFQNHATKPILVKDILNFYNRA